MNLRPASADDVPVLASIDALSNPGSWSPNAFRDELNRGVSRVLVASLPHEGVVGFVAWWVVGEELEVLNIAVHPKSRRQGIARKLLVAALADGSSRGATLAFLEVRESNTPARSFYQSESFAEVGIRRGYYPGGEDGVRMMRPLE